MTVDGHEDRRRTGTAPDGRATASLSLPRLGVCIDARGPDAELLAQVSTPRASSTSVPPDASPAWGPV